MTVAGGFRLVAWSFVTAVLSMAVCFQSRARPDWCPLGHDPALCVTQGAFA